jgi:hypothetical protein
MSPALLPLALLLAAAPPANRPHPAVGPEAPGDACRDCHAERTPDVVREWEAGPHGLLLVKCLVCHGSTGKDFARRPDPRRCAGCHADQVASVVPARRGAKPAADCFSCHSPHSLAAEGGPNPHVAR